MWVMVYFLSRGDIRPGFSRVIDKDALRHFQPGQTVTMAEEIWDCIVVGAGIIGSYTAYHLVRDGCKTLLLEQVCYHGYARGGIILHPSP